MSVITTAFNAEPFVEAAVRSVLEQRGVDVEHIIVDDGSTDSTVAVVTRINDQRVRLIEAGRIGRGRALNVALAACRCDYIAVQDADDLSHPDRLATAWRFMQHRPELAVVGSGQILMKSGEVPQWRPLAVPPTIRTVARDLLYYNPLSHSSVMFRRPWLDKVGGYDDRRTALFDWNLYIRFAACGAALGKLSVPLVAKRIHEAQFFEGRHQTRYAFECLKLQWQALSLLRRNRLLSLSFPILFAYRMMSRPARLFLRQSLMDLRDRPGGLPAIR